jgi:hypothetical protein
MILREYIAGIGQGTDPLENIGPMTFGPAGIDAQCSNIGLLGNSYVVWPLSHIMGDPACYRDYCPECNLQVTISDEECPECGTHLPQDDG